LRQQLLRFLVRPKLGHSHNEDNLAAAAEEKSAMMVIAVARTDMSALEDSVAASMDGGKSIDDPSCRRI
jgi:hypothetical protein